MLVSILGSSAGTLIVAVGIGTAPGYARMVRGQILAAKRSGYVEAAAALGHRRGRPIRRHILPNAFRPLVALFTMAIGQTIVWASGMAFIGLGVAPPSPEWGALLDAGRDSMTQAGWLIVVPGLVIVNRRSSHRTPIDRGDVQTSPRWSVFESAGGPEPVVKRVRAPR